MKTKNLLFQSRACSPREIFTANLASVLLFLGQELEATPRGNNLQDEHTKEPGPLLGKNYLNEAIIPMFSLTKTKEKHRNQQKEDVDYSSIEDIKSLHIEQVGEISSQFINRSAAKDSKESFENINFCKFWCARQELPKFRRVCESFKQFVARVCRIFIIWTQLTQKNYITCAPHNLRQTLFAII